MSGSSSSCFLSLVTFFTQSFLIARLEFDFVMTNNCQILFLWLKPMKLVFELWCKGELECLQVVEKGRAAIAASFYSISVSQRKYRNSNTQNRNNIYVMLLWLVKGEEKKNEWKRKCVCVFVFVFLSSFNISFWARAKILGCHYPHSFFCDTGWLVLLFPFVIKNNHDWTACPWN